MKSKSTNKNTNKTGTLYIVSTPIGNLGDWTYRAVESVKACNIVACEDTRVTRVLLDHYGISKRLFSFHEHSSEKDIETLMEALRNGESVALLSDAGTPLISDPGHPLVTKVIEENIAITSIPGASSVLAALTISGLPLTSFTFAGFAPQKTTARKKFLKSFAAVPGTLVFFESPKRLLATLEDMHAVLGNRDAAVARELTKLFEECVRGTLAEILSEFSHRPSIKGECVIMLAPGEAVSEEIDLDALLISLLREHSLRDATSEAASITGLPRQAVYKRALELKNI